jgi:hypothetical protein
VETSADLAAAEDVLLFIGAAITATGQREFHTGTRDQRIALDFLHEYMLVNYRDLYAGVLALDVNDHNTALIIRRLLASANDAVPLQRRTEGRLIARALRRLSPPRVYRLFGELRRTGINNRRTRAIMREWLAARPDLAFDAVKYRTALKTAARHAHLRLDGELGTFLFAPQSAKRFATPIFETWRRAHYEQAALYELPYTVAEGFAAKHGLSRGAFLERIAPRLTRLERLRLQGAASESGAAAIRLGRDELARMPLTRLALYVLSLRLDERSERRTELTGALRAAARRAADDQAGTWGRVAAVLDDSHSSSGSTAKRRRPLAVALGCHYLLEALADEYVPLWMTGRQDVLLTYPLGHTALGARIVDALDHAPDRLVIVSDGWDNAPAGMAAEVLRVWSTRLDRDRSTSIVHANPVFDADGLEVRTLAPSVPTTGIREAEDLPTLIEFAGFAEGRTGLPELRAHMASRAERFLAEKAP